jgi:hypothetical protein
LNTHKKQIKGAMNSLFSPLNKSKTHHITMANKRKATEMEGIVFMMNGLPGAMGLEVSAACLRRGMECAPIALTGPGCPGSVAVSDGEGGAEQQVRLLNASGEGVDVEVKTVVEKYGDRLVSFICASSSVGYLLLFGFRLQSILPTQQQ